MTTTDRPLPDRVRTLVVGTGVAGLGHTSIVYLIESQIAYALDALERMDADGLVAVEPRRDAQDRVRHLLLQQPQGHPLGDAHDGGLHGEADQPALAADVQAAAVELLRRRHHTSRRFYLLL